MTRAGAPARAFALALIGGFLYLAAFYAPGAWFLIFFSLVPLLAAVREAKSTGTAYAASLVFAAIVVGGTMAWVLESVIVLDPATLHFLRFGTFLSWLLVIAACAPVLALSGIVARAVPLRARYVPAVAAAWICLEAARMLAYNVITRAAHIDQPLFFSAGFIGYPLADSSAWVQLAALGGVAALGFTVVAVNAGIYLALSRTAHRPRTALIIACSLAAITALPIASWRASLAAPASREVAVAFMSLYEERLALPSEYRPKLYGLIEGLKQAEIVVLPEGVQVFSDTATSLASSLPESAGQVFVESKRAQVTEGPMLEVAQAISLGAGMRVPIRSKGVLAPQGEYPVDLFSSFFRNARSAPAFEVRWNVRTGKEGEYGQGAFSYAGARATVLFCLENMRPGLARHLADSGSANLLLFPVSQLDFAGSYLLDRDTFRFVRTQVVEAGRPGVMSGNWAPSYAFDAYGTVLVSVGLDGVTEAGIVRIPLP